MSFKTNDFKQLSLDDRYDSQTQRVKNIVIKSWAKGFSDIVFLYFKAKINFLDLIHLQMLSLEH